MTVKRHPLRNMEESPGERDQGPPDVSLRRGQIVALQFLEEGGGPGEIMDVVTLEQRSDGAYVGELLSAPIVVALSLGDHIEFGREHIVELFEGPVSVGTQEIDHYEDRISLGAADVEPIELRRLRYFPYLDHLDLAGTPVEDVSFLSETPGLFVLNVDGTSVSDLTPVGALWHLRCLFAAETNIEDLEPLKSLTKLTGLRLTDTRVCDLSPLVRLGSLQYLNVGMNKVWTMPLLDGLPSLEVLDISCTLISDLSFVSRCSSLRTLNALMSDFDSLAPLGSATALRRLTLSVTSAADFSALHALKGLEYVGIYVGSEERVERSQRLSLDHLASRGVDVVYSNNVDELVDLLSPAIH